MKILQCLKLFAISNLVYFSLFISPVMAFDLGNIISKSIEKSIDRSVRSVENTVTNEF